MRQQSDLIRELIDRLLQAARREGQLTEDLARAVEQDFRRDFNGAEYYVKERTESRLAEKQAVVVGAYLKGQPVDQIVRENGISRATLYRYLKR